MKNKFFTRKFVPAAQIRRLRKGMVIKMRLVWHSFIIQKKNLMFWVNLIFVLFLSADIMSYSIFHMGEDLRIYWIFWTWIWISPMVENSNAQGSIYSYLPLDLRDKKKIYLDYILVIFFIMWFAQFLLYIVMICIERSAVYMLCHVSGWLASILLFVYVNMLVTKRCRVDCLDVSKRVTIASLINVVLCIVMCMFPDYKMGEGIGYWIFLAIYILTAATVIIMIRFSYIDYIPKDSLGIYDKGGKKTYYYGG